MAPKVCLGIPILLLLVLAACQAQAAFTSTPVPTSSPVASPTSSPLPPSPTSPPSLIPSLTPTLFPLPVSTGTIVACDERRPPTDDLLPVVTASFGLAPDYVPPELVRLGNYVSGYVTLPDLMLRREAAEALGKLVVAMKTDGLAPTILSSYRSYYEQAVAYNRWTVQDPANASRVSAQPGHSEHQLGTVVDFGSLELPGLTGDSSLKFSPLFSQTGEGLWLASHAQEYGFTLTNPPDAEPWTGLIYEPWHYRYIGVDLATYLHESGDFLSEFLLSVRPALPCIPSLGKP